MKMCFDDDESAAFHYDSNVPSSSSSSLDSGIDDECLLTPEVAAELPTIWLSITSSQNDNESDVCSEFQLTRKLGEGGFGQVYLGQRAGHRRSVAVKLIGCRGGSLMEPGRKPSSGIGGLTRATVDSLRSEVIALGLEHPNVVRVFAAGWTMSTLVDGETNRRSLTSDTVGALVMEFGGSSSLQKIIDNDNESVNFERRVRYAYDISSALAYIHSRSVVHLDLKPANVVVSSTDDRCKLTDFGCARRLSSTCDVIADDDHLVPASLMTHLASSTNVLRRNHRAAAAAAGGAGTVIYQAPEMINVSSGRGVDRCSVKADVYSLGVLLWQLVSRRIPFAEFDSPMTVMYNVVKYSARPDGTTTNPHRQVPAVTWSDGQLEADYRQVYRDCWNADVAARPTAEYLVRVFDDWRQYSASSPTIPS